jgi:hypothetical protein
MLMGAGAIRHKSRGGVRLVWLRETYDDARLAGGAKIAPLRVTIRPIFFRHRAWQLR